MSRTPRKKMPDANSLLPCPVCKSATLSEPGEYEICPVCGWEDDPSQTADPSEPGANSISLNTARRRWRKHLKETPEGETPGPLFDSE